MNSITNFYDYKITSDPNFQNDYFGNTPELTKQLEDLAFEAQDKKNKKKYRQTDTTHC